MPALDGLRGVLLIVVALFHFSLVAGWESPHILFPGAFFGPSTFFTLSGYLITSLLLVERERTGTVNRAGFWGRRFRRLLPSSTAAIVVIVVILVIWPTVWGPFAGSDVAAGFTGLANWHAIDLANGDEPFRLLGPLGVFWSLSLEEQFYLLLFGLLVFAIGRGQKMMHWFVGSLIALWLISVTSLLVVVSTPQREFFGTDTRASEAVAGCLLAVWVHHRGMPRNRFTRFLGWASLAVAVVCWLYVHESDVWVSRWGLPAFALVSCAMIVGLSSHGSAASVLASKPLVLLGRISYPAYIIHWPLTLLMTSDRMHVSGWPLIGLRFAVTVAIAYLMFRFLELPLKDSRLVSWPNGLIIWGVLAVGATVTTIAVAGWG